jgi:Lsr2
MHRIDDQNGAAVMAQKVQTLFVDDLDGSEAEGTVRFGLDGTDYEIDLNAKNARQLRDALARYMAAGRRVRASTRQPVRSGHKAQPNALNTTEVREWAKARASTSKTAAGYPPNSWSNSRQRRETNAQDVPVSSKVRGK